MGIRSSILAVAAVIGMTGHGFSDDDATFFKQQIEPLLEKRCYDCHSHRAREMNGGLTLDSRSGWETGGDRGPAIVPGKPDSSLLIRAIRHTDPDLKMPEDKLPESEIKLLTEWVQRGAADPRTLPASDENPRDWWSLKPLERPPVPSSMSANPVDAFIRHQLREKKLTPSPEADRRTLVRRLYFDLHGLPPTPEEASAFLSDESQDAWPRLVNRLLESPRYGERWARHWLDVVHFADSHGFEHDVFRPNAWRYRDYVIDSLNADLPWSQFIREQLAVDAISPNETHRLPALGFLGAGTYDHSAAATALHSFEYLDRDDLVTQTTAAFLSTTASCARCHTHKFDPIRQEDYFALQAVFAGIGKGDISFDDDPAVAAKRKQWSDLVTAADQKQRDVLLSPGYAEIVARWEESRARDVNWEVLAPEVFISSDGASLTKQQDGSFLSGGTRPAQDTSTLIASVALRSVSAIRLEVLTDDSLPGKGPGRAENGNLHLTEIEAKLFRPGATEAVPLRFQSASADFDQEGWTSRHAIDGDPKTAWGIHPQEGQSHLAVFTLHETLAIEPGHKLVILLKQLHGRGHVIGRFRLAVTDAPAAAAAVLPQDLAAIFAISADQRSLDQRIALAAHALKEYAQTELAKLPAMVQVYAAAATAKSERGTISFEKPRVIHVLARGELGKPGRIVGPGALSGVSDLPARFELQNPDDEKARRAALADWIANPANPLTWRSIANRVWQHHFGEGLCNTPNDFGRMGGTPSHPELLDWLAVEFRDHHGSLKHLHRLICTSETYRQSSAHRPEVDAIDPENRSLARMNRSRIDADSARDAVLLVSGRLDTRHGGPGVAQFNQSPGPQLTPKLDYATFDWNTPGASRRCIYRVVWRGIADPFMDALDFPDLALSTPKRGFSASPLQSLTLLNNPFIIFHSDRFAERLQRTSPGAAEQVRQAFQLTLLRDPTPTEAATFVNLADNAGLAAVCRALFNCNEFLFVD
jgi:hypothetical protein